MKKVKRFICLALSVFMLIALVPGVYTDARATTVKMNAFLGDVNFDSGITAADARRVLRVSVGLEAFTDSQIFISDIDKNGKITAADARIVLRVSVKLEKTETVLVDVEIENLRLEATEKDYEKLINMARLNLPEFESGRSSAESVLSCIVNERNGVYRYYRSEYGTEFRGSGNDPLNMFESYRWFDFESIKWIAENIFHTDFIDTYESKGAYCYDGKIYFYYGGPGAAGMRPPHASIESTQRLEDGRYDIVIAYRYYEENDPVQERDHVIADIIEFDGQRCWTFYLIEHVM